MPPFSRGLALVLTFWVVAWPAASIRTRLPGSGWWGTQEALALRQATRAPAPAGDFAESARVYPEHAANRGIQTHSTSRTTKPGSAQAVERLKVRLTKMEALARLGSWRIKAENFLGNASLIHFHHRLRSFEILLSFGLVERELRQARTTDVEDIGVRLYTARFRQVRAQAGHSLQVIAGALLPESLAPFSLNGFPASGDPISNFIDPGWKSELPAGGPYAQ